MADGFKYSGGSQGESGKMPSSGGGRSTAGRTSFGDADTPNLQGYNSYRNTPKRGVGIKQPPKDSMGGGNGGSY